MEVRFPLTAAALIAAAAIPARALGAEEAPIRPDATMIQYPDVSEMDIVFVYANDLWLVPRAGGTARKLASPPGQESFPRFSPDGKIVAFVGNYDGDTDIYTIPADNAGTAFRVTHHPTNEILWDWTADNRLLFFAPGGVESNILVNRLYTVPPTGGLPASLPVPYGTAGTISSDGQWLAYTPHIHDFRTWKRYRGGMATDVWLFNLNTKQSRRATEWEGTDSQPMWHGNTVYYLSDAGPEHRLNIWSFDPATGDHAQVTFFEEFDTKWPSMGPGPDGRGEIVLQNGTQIHLLDLKTGKTRPVEITIPGDRPALRDQLVDHAEFIQAYAVSPTGERAVVQARGDIWTLPAEKGITRNLTRTSGVAERDPVWSPDGRWIAYLSDETGEYEIYITQSDGKGETRQLTSDGTAYRYLKSWSPDSKKILFSDKTGAMHLIDVETKAVTHVATDAWANQVEPSWTRDSRWLAFSLADEANSQGVIHLYNVETGELTPVTDPMFNSSDAAFDRKGDFLYFTSNRHFSPVYSDIDTTFVYRDSQVVLAVPLRADVESPWKLENNEEKWDDKAKDDEKKDDEKKDNGEKADEGEDAKDGDDAKDGEEKKDADAANAKFADYDTEHPLWGVWAGNVFGPAGMFPAEGIAFEMTILTAKDGTITGWSTSQGEKESYDTITFENGVVKFTWSANGMDSTAEATVTDDSMSGTWKMAAAGLEGTFEAKRSDSEPDLGDAASGSKEKDEAKPVVIELADFESRAIQLEIDPGQFGGLEVNDKGQLLYIRAADDGLPSVMLYEIEDGKGKEKSVISGVTGFVLTSDGKKMLTGNPGAGMAIVSAAPGQSLAKTVNTSQMKMTVSPREEWRQLFTDAWRVQRDFFYDEGLHGVDWTYMRDRYGAMIEDCATREDVSFVIRELISELNVGHAYYSGGDVEDQPSRNVGLLGCDFELASTDEGSAYRIRKIYRGAPWDTDAVGPLSRLGVNVKEGDFLLEVNGVPVDTARDPWFAFLGTAGQVTMLTVSEKPVRDDTAREVLVEPVSNDANLRYRHRIEQNRAYVDYKSGGKVGYIYVPNTGVNGQNDLFRQFYGQREKQALIIDERWNGGGQIPTRFIELLNRPRTNYWARRDGKDWPWPPDSHQGPKCMLINGLAGSGGDMFPALFKQTGLGKLIGTRTWGGLVGISGNPGLIDGGSVTAPTFGYYETDGTWGIEGHGVDPDIEVLDDPALMVGAPEVVADPQLDAAIELMQAEIQRTPYVRPARPASPDRRGMGIREEDK